MSSSNNEHPADRDPADLRIAILGAGISGLSCALQLLDRGYRHIHLYERSPSPGGLAATVEFDDHSYDIGALLIGGGHSRLRELCARFSIPLTAARSRVQLAEKTKPIRFDQQEAVPAQVARLRKVLAATTEPLYAPIAQFAADTRTGGLYDYWHACFCSSGYGYPESNVPMEYLVRFIEVSDGAASVIADGSGFAGLFRKIIQHLDAQSAGAFKLHLSHEVVGVRRVGERPLLTVRGAGTHGPEQTLDYDRILCTTSPRDTLGYLDCLPQERDLLSSVRYHPYCTSVVRLAYKNQHARDLLSPLGMTVIPAHCRSIDQAGRPVAFYRAHPDTDVFLFYSYGPGGEPESDRLVVTHLLKDYVENVLNCALADLLYQKHHAIFGHVDSETMQRGFHRKLDALQGKGNVFHCSSFMSFELVECCLRQSETLIAAHFTSTCSPSRAIEVEEESPAEWPRIPLGDALSNTARSHPDKVGYIWLDSALKATDRVTFAQLSQQARAIAHYLLTVRKHQPGDRVILCFPPGLSFLRALFGCFYAGLIAVPVYPPSPSRLKLDVDRFSAITRDCAATTVLSDRAYLAVKALKSVTSWLRIGGSERAEWPAGLKWVSVESIWNDSPPPGYQPPIVDPKATALLQYTAGSTSAPRGVMLSHANILHNVFLQGEGGVTPESRFVFFVPQYHDLGLIGGFIQSAVRGAQSISMSPLTYLQNPVSWMQTCSKYQATHTAAPNSALELCNKRILSDPGAREAVKKLDLSNLYLYCGGEPIRWNSVEQFCELHGLPLSRFRGVYGLAESVTYTTGMARRLTHVQVRSDSLLKGRVELQDEADARSTTLASVGVPSARHSVFVAIVDSETNRTRPEGIIGEVMVSSPSNGMGYWNNPPESRNTFGLSPNRRAGAPPLTQPYVRTGDLGFLLHGHLFITGRVKDLLVLNGRNHYPQDLEFTVERQAGVRKGCSAVFGVTVDRLSWRFPSEVAALSAAERSALDDESELICVVAESPNREVRPDCLSAIRRAILAEHGLKVACIVLIPPRAICKTTSGKIQRRQTREYLLSHLLPILRCEIGFGSGAESAQPDRAEGSTEPGSAGDAKHHNDFVHEAVAGLVAELADVEPGRRASSSRR